MELLAWCRPLDSRLRLPHRWRARMEPGVAQTAAGRARLFARPARAGVRSNSRQAIQRSVAGAGCQRRVDSEFTGFARTVFVRSSRTLPDRGRIVPGLDVFGSTTNAAPDVYELWLVLQRHFRNRNPANPEVCG